MKRWMGVVVWLCAGFVLAGPEVRPLMIGQPIPAVELTKSNGRRVNLKLEALKQPLVVVFYRGGWCPFCTRHLGQLQAALPQLDELGYKVLAISPDRPEKVMETQLAGSMDYTLLSDSSMEAAKAFGIAFKVDDPMLKKLASYKIDIEAASGEKHHLLPVPAVFLVGVDGVIDFSYVNPDYKTRLAPEVLVAAAKAAKGEG